MPEYLHPGVYVEETSYRGKPIEGVSTSTAGFVGRARTGSPGRPTLVTSYAQFVREFGAPYSSPDATKGEMLAHAVRGFFDNGGKRAWIVRVLGSGALASAAPLVAATGTAPASSPGLTRGVVLRLAKNTSVLAWAGSATGVTLKLNSTRGVRKGTVLRIFSRSSSASPWTELGTFTTTAFSPSTNTVTFDAGGTANPATLSADHTFVLIASADAVGPFNATGAQNSAVAAPTFTARDKGVGGDALAVAFTPVDRPLVAVTARTTTTLTLASVANVYPGAIVEWHKDAAGTETKGVAVVTAVDTTLKRITVASPPTIAGATVTVRVLELNLDIYKDGVIVESFGNLTWNRDPSVPESYARYWAARVNDADTGSRYVTVTDPAGAADLRDMPTTTEALPVSLTGGDDGADPGAPDFVGTDGGPGNRTGIESLKERDDVSMCAVPGVVDEAVQGALITHAELMRYRVAVLDGNANEPNVANIQAHRNNYDSSRAAYYTPWLETLDLTTGASVVVPPSGHVMGIWARTDNERGVHKAPANEVVRGITDVQLRFGDGEQDVLNPSPSNINLIREFTGRGIRVWGARTITSDQEWKYLNVRRLFNYVGQSIDRGTQWVVFEPNNEALWARVAQTIEAFLIGVWKTGALMGTSPKEAFFVRCDRTTMTQDDIDNGRLIVQIGLAPTKPAEFVIFRIGQFTASSSSS